MSENEQSGTDVAVSEPSAADKRAAKQQTSQREPRFSLERLLGSDGPAITGHRHHVIAGAFHDVDDQDADFTRAAAQQKIDKWLEQPVERDAPDPLAEAEQEDD